MKIVVIGGTGLIGSKVVEKLAAKSHDVLAAAPSTGVDVISGKGLEEALRGADVVVDLSNSPSFEAQAATDFFQTAGRNVRMAEIGAGVTHHVALSVVGTERLQEMGYFRAKLAQEDQVRHSPIPYTLVRATQFFEFLRGIAGASTVDGVVRLPHARFQPMAAEDVASAVAAAALARPVNAMIEVAGPEPFWMDELVERVLAHDRDPRAVVSDPEARYFELRVDNGLLMPGAGARLGSTTFDRWLAEARAS